MTIESSRRYDLNLWIGYLVEAHSNFLAGAKRASTGVGAPVRKVTPMLR
jgi:hypothetical protein